MRLFNKIKKEIRKLKVRKIKDLDKTHKGYFNIQINQSLGKIDKNASFRYKKIISKLLPYIVKDERSDKFVLCIGCRNIFELNEFERVGFDNVLGIDLFSDNKKILIMDMHNMTFDKNSFDVIYSADSLEHTYDPQLVVNNILKVLKNGGYVCLSVPIAWRKTQGREGEDLSQLADCQDFDSKEDVYNLFSKANYKIQHEEFYKAPCGVNNLLSIIQIWKL